MVFTTIADVMFNPQAFFRSLRGKRDVLDAVKFLLIVLSIFVLLEVVIGHFMTPVYANIFASVFESYGLPLGELQADMNSYGTAIYYGQLAAGYLAGVIFGLIGAFIMSAILFIWLLIFGVREDFFEVFNLYVYGNVPSFVLSFIPVVNLFAWIWSLVLLVTGTEEMFGVSKGKAVMIYLIPVIIYAIVMALLVVLFFSFFSALFAGSLF